MILLSLTSVQNRKMRQHQILRGIIVLYCVKNNQGNYQTDMEFCHFNPQGNVKAVLTFNV